MVNQTVALVVAAGRGSRVAANRPKQYLPLAGRPILARTLTRLVEHPRIDGVRVVIHPDDRSAYAEATKGLALLDPVEGGATRQISVRNGLESLEPHAPERVLIHDGARPFIDEGLVDRVLDALDHHAAAIPAIPVSDTLKRCDNGRIAATVPRDDLWRAQTPQGFRFAEILAAHRAVAAHRALADGSELSDDASVAEAAGLECALVEGCSDNMKVTTSDDLMRAERRLAGAGDIRTGQGFDVHRFGDQPGPVMLCGVAVPHERTLSGHSDADVGLHVVVDAILGALAEGDIGHHFPPSDPRWKGANSAIFVEHVRHLVAERGAGVLSVDVTLVCERPRIGPHREAMTARVAGLLGIDPQRVSVKGTTTEGLGFTGRGEGIAAQAVATLRVPAESP